MSKEALKAILSERKWKDVEAKPPNLGDPIDPHPKKIALLASKVPPPELARLGLALLALYRDAQPDKTVNDTAVIQCTVFRQNCLAVPSDLAEVLDNERAQQAVAIINELAQINKNPQNHLR